MKKPRTDYPNSIAQGSRRLRRYPTFASEVATFVSEVATFVSEVATFASEVATFASEVAIFKKSGLFCGNI